MGESCPRELSGEELSGGEFTGHRGKRISSEICCILYDAFSYILNAPNQLFLDGYSLVVIFISPQ